MAPLSRAPSSWHPSLFIPSPPGPSNHPLQPPSPTHHLRQGSSLRLVTAATPFSNTRGPIGPTPFSTPGTGDSSPPKPTLAYTARPAAPEPGPGLRFHSLPATSGILPLSLGTGLTTPRPSFHSSPTPNCQEGHGNTGLRPSRTPSPRLLPPPFRSVVVGSPGFYSLGTPDLYWPSKFTVVKGWEPGLLGGHCWAL